MRELRSHTGASGGLGQAFVRELGRSGYRVTMVARRSSALEQLTGETHLEHATEPLGPTEAALEPIDVSVNNAGSVVAGRFVDVSEVRR